MAAVQEVLVTSCLNDPAASASVWDPHTGTSLMIYRGDSTVTLTGLSLLAGQYVLAALQDKPFLRIWPINSQQPLTAPRLVCPGRVSRVQASPDNCYIAIIVAEKLHVFQVGSGRLVGTGSRHFQPILVVRWTSDGNQLACGGEDGIVTVWALGQLATATSTPAEARLVLADHTLPVTDLTITPGNRARLFSVSADRTCKIYDLRPGQLLATLVFDNMLTSVATSALETEIFVGTNKGPVLQFSLLSPPRNLEYHLTAKENAPVFTGHTKAVKCLSTSANGQLLASGSSDGTVKIWHINSRQCLRTLSLKGPVTNTFFAVKPKQLFENELKPSVVLSAFQTANTEKTDAVEVISLQSLALDELPSRDIWPKKATGASDDKVKSLHMEIELLKSINKQLFDFSVKNIVKQADSPQAQAAASQKSSSSKKRKRKLPKDIVEVRDSKIKNSPNQSQETSHSNVSTNGIKKNKKKKKKKSKSVQLC